MTTLETPSKRVTIQNIRNSYVALRKAAATHRKARTELVINVAIYFQSMLRDGYKRKEITDSLVNDVGATRSYWGQARFLGEKVLEGKAQGWIKSNDISISAFREIAYKRERIRPKDMKRVAQLLNEGIGQGKMQTELRKMGYASYKTPIPRSKQKIQAEHKTWESWEPEMRALVEAIRKTTDAEVCLVDLVLLINNEEKLTVTATEEN